MQAKVERRLTRGELKPLSKLIDQLGFAGQFAGEASVFGADPVIASPHRLGEASATAQLLIGVAAAAIFTARTGRTTDVSIDIIDALHHLHSTHFVYQAGQPVNVGAEHVAVNDLFQCRDGRYVMLEAGPPYAKLLDGYLNFLDCGNNKESIARAVAGWDSEELEEALSRASLPACRALSAKEWLHHPQGRLLSRTPVVEIEKIAPGPPAPFIGSGTAAPLEGIRALDFTHVLAGPSSTRSLAEYGADVLHISSPAYADTLAQHLGVDVGKRCAYLNLRTEEGRQTMRRLAAEADVFTSTYRPSVNDRFGLVPQHLAQSSERGIICMTANAYGHAGPWSGRPGFDQNGQTASGFAVTEGAPGPPRFSPVFYLADLITGYLAAAGMMAALLRRSVEGGSYHVRLSLTRSAMWVQELGLLSSEALTGIPSRDEYDATMSTIDTEYGPITQLAPALEFSALSLPPVTNLVPYGSDPAEWLPRGR
jgi:crotonobetainyl-CoA:carnitine CoA-transferase CaiB-like acyl-CoA transferase